MPLFFELLEKDAVKATYKIRPGLRVGRTRGEILLSDSKVSSLHAFVETNKKDQLILVDNDSSNGIRVNNRRVAQAILLPGVTIQIGRMSLRVVEFDHEEYQPKVTDWKEALRRTLSQKAAELEVSHNDKIHAFQPAVSLFFIEGIQLDTVWTLGYGPRLCGAASLDLQLYEEGLPGDAFKISPDENGHPLFQTDHSNVILYNESAVESATMKTGDIIQCGKTKIRVEIEA